MTFNELLFLLRVKFVVSLVTNTSPIRSEHKFNIFYQRKHKLTRQSNKRTRKTRTISFHVNFILYVCSRSAQFPSIPGYWLHQDGSQVGVAARQLWEQTTLVGFLVLVTTSWYPGTFSMNSRLPNPLEWCCGHTLLILGGLGKSSLLV